jgi:hypothetical protein
LSTSTLIREDLRRRAPEIVNTLPGLHVDTLVRVVQRAGITTLAELRKVSTQSFTASLTVQDLHFIRDALVKYDGPSPFNH